MSIFPDSDTTWYGRPSSPVAHVIRSAYCGLISARTRSTTDSRVVPAGRKCAPQESAAMPVSSRYSRRAFCPQVSGAVPAPGPEKGMVIRSEVVGSTMGFPSSTAEDQADVVAAEAERVRHDGIHLGRQRNLPYMAQVAGRVRVVQVVRRREQTVAQRHDADRGLEHARDAEHVPGHPLG